MVAAFQQKSLPPPLVGSATTTTTTRSEHKVLPPNAGKMLNKRAAFNRAKKIPVTLRAQSTTTSSPEQPRRVENVEKHASFMSKTLFVELGVGSDQHGQDGTKAAVRACKDAISFNSLPAIADLIPGGYGGMKLHVLIAAPINEYPVDVDEVKKVFPYGNVNVELVRGGMVAASATTGSDACCSARLDVARLRPQTSETPPHLRRSSRPPKACIWMHATIMTAPKTIWKMVALDLGLRNLIQNQN